MKFVLFFLISFLIGALAHEIDLADGCKERGHAFGFIKDFTCSIDGK
jgi:hypothetical protein